jgi:hypothetical protein
VPNGSVQHTARSDGDTTREGARRSPDKLTADSVQTPPAVNAKIMSSPFLKLPEFYRPPISGSVITPSRPSTIPLGMAPSWLPPLKCEEWLV